jgi:uncharacterized membrane protein
MALNANHEIERLQRAEDRFADRITDFAGSLRFVRLHVVWFSLWILVNLGAFGASLKFDPYPFGLLTLVVSLEAIFLSTFVMISQNRQAAASEIRSELDYRTNLMAEREVDLVMRALERMASKQGVDVSDLGEMLLDVRARYLESTNHPGGGSAVP